MGKIGFIGLGIMGSPMATNLVRAGVDLTVNDLLPEAVEKLKKQGAAAADDAYIAQNCDIIFTIVPNGKISRELITGPEGLFPHLKKGALVVDMSSVTPDDSRYCADKLSEIGVEFLDAPVSGGEEGAVNGSLAIMVGGSQHSFDRAKKYFDIMDSKALLVGEVGSGSVTKLANQIIVNLNIAAISEALVFAKKAGTDPEKVFQAIRTGLAGSRVLEDKAPRMLTNSFEPGGTIAINSKDIRNVIDTAHNAEIPVPMSATLFEVMQSLKLHGDTQKDHSAIIRYFERLAGMDSL